MKPGPTNFGRPGTSVRRPGAGRVPRWVLDPDAPSHNKATRISAKKGVSAGDKDGLFDG